MQLSLPRRRFLIPAALLIVSRVADAASTWYESPSLRNEANPIASVFGGGWREILIANALGVTVILLALWKRVTEEPLRLPQEPGLGFPQFVDALFRGPRRQRRWHHWLRGRPSDARVMVHLFGAIAPPTLTCAGFLVAGHNVLLRASTGYRAGPAAWIGLGLSYATVVIGAVGFALLFVRREYSRYRERPSEVRNALEVTPASEQRSAARVPRSESSS